MTNNPPLKPPPRPDTEINPGFVGEKAEKIEVFAVARIAYILDAQAHFQHLSSRRTGICRTEVKGMRRIEAKHGEGIWRRLEQTFLRQPCLAQNGSSEQPNIRFTAR